MGITFIKLYMSLVSKFTSVFSDNRISRLDEEFNKNDTELPTGIYIYMNYASKEHKDNSTIVIRKHKNDQTGDVLLSLESEMDTWYIRDYNHSIVTEVEGKEIIEIYPNK